MQQLKRHFLGLFLLGAALIAASGFAAPPKNALPTPPEAAPEIIAEDMRLNGAPMQIIQFTTLDADDTLKFYRDYFRKHAQKGIFSETNTDNRRMIAGMLGEKGDRLLNVEITPQGKKLMHVFVSTLEPEQMQHPEKLAKAFPRMSGTQVIQHQSSRDGPKSNQFVIMQNRHSVEGNAMYLREHLLRAGWRRESDETLQPAVHRQLVFSNGSKQMLVDVQKQDSDNTMIIFNEMSE